MDRKSSGEFELGRNSLMGMDANNIISIYNQVDFISVSSSFFWLGKNLSNSELLCPRDISAFMRLFGDLLKW
jgi:hypothetical protein